MIRGLDTSFLIQVEVAGHPGHETARALMERLLNQGDVLGLAPQVMAEFIHVVTDPRRFEQPLEVEQAVRRAQFWWDAREVERIHPTPESTRLFLSWMDQYKLGRKRILDTQLAATYFQAGVTSLLSTDVRDFRVFGCFKVLDPSRMGLS